MGLIPKSLRFQAPVTLASQGSRESARNRVHAVQCVSATTAVEMLLCSSCDHVTELGLCDHVTELGL